MWLWSRRSAINKYFLYAVYILEAGKTLNLLEYTGTAVGCTVLDWIPRVWTSILRKEGRKEEREGGRTGGK